MPYLQINGANIYYTDSGGTGQPILFIHGWGGNSQEWCPQLAALTPQFRILAPDLRGHGHSHHAPGSYSPRQLASDTAEILDAVDCPPVLAVGHSMGGQVVTALAVEHPAAVTGLVLLDPAIGAVGTEAADVHRRLERLYRGGWVEALNVLAGAFTPDTPATVAIWHRREMESMNAHVLGQCYAAMYTEEDAFGLRLASERYLARVRQPTLAIMTTRERQQWLSTTLNDERSKVELWEGCGHYVHEEHPERLARLIAEWIPSS
jgi:pimeloyl-ACP methyl ester carboxylesterase